LVYSFVFVRYVLICVCVYVQRCWVFAYFIFIIFLVKFDFYLSKFVFVGFFFVFFVFFAGLCVSLCLSLWLLFGLLLGICKCIFVSLSICLNLSFVMSLLAILLGLWGYLCVLPLFMFMCVHYVQVCLSLFNVHCLCMWIATNLINLEFFWKVHLTMDKDLLYFFMSKKL
jgi:hypothetical protein